MELQNGYSIIYNAPERVSETAPGPIYANKKINLTGEDSMLISYDSENNYVDLNNFKLIYSHDDKLFGSVKQVPTQNDTQIIIKDVAGNIVFGDEVVVTAKKQVNRAQRKADEQKKEKNKEEKIALDKIEAETVEE